MNNLIQKLFNGHSLSGDETFSLFDAMLKGELEPVIISAILIAFKSHGETASEISGAARALLSHSRDFSPSLIQYADCCGTGGDGKGLVNISTAVSFVAPACGLPIVKHGNRSVSSLSGSADVLECLGINLETDLNVLHQQLSNQGLTFIFAPFFHPALKQIMPIRTALATRTLFNILGPLVNPARPTVQLMGVYSEGLCQPIAETLSQLGLKKGMVVHGSGLDEIAIHDKTQAVLIKDNKLTSLILTPTSMGVKQHPLASLIGGSPQENSVRLKAVLNGQGEEAYVDAVAVNTAALLWTADLCEDIQQGVHMAKEVISSGAPAKILQGLVEPQNNAEYKLAPSDEGTQA